MSQMPEVGDVVDLFIEKIVAGGDGLARLALPLVDELSTGKSLVCFVPFVVPGEEIRARIVEKKASYARAEIVTISKASPFRVEAPCPYYTRCGGCQSQHVTYEEELRWKEAQVREAFVRVGRISNAPLLPILPSPCHYKYRNRVTVHASGGVVGFHDLSGRKLVDIASCLLARDEVNRELAQLRAKNPPEGHYSLREPSIPPSGFYQANQELLPSLRLLICSALPEEGDLLLEGYCGGGFLTEVAAPRFRKVIAVDNDPRTLRDAQRLPLPQTEWIQGDAGQELAGQLLALRAGEKATVLLDPPREGLPEPLINALLFRPVQHLIYLSCNPATLARDARHLCDKYRLISVQPIDLFPRTGQIECLSRWMRKSE